METNELADRICIQNYLLLVKIGQDQDVTKDMTCVELRSIYYVKGIMVWDGTIYTITYHTKLQAAILYDTLNRRCNPPILLSNGTISYHHTSYRTNGRIWYNIVRTLLPSSESPEVSLHD